MTSILSSRPIWDVIAIFILLLNLPPAAATAVQFFFALITFFPPTSTTAAWTYAAAPTPTTSAPVPSAVGASISTNNATYGLASGSSGSVISSNITNTSSHTSNSASHQQGPALTGVIGAMSVRTKLMVDVAVLALILLLSTPLLNITLDLSQTVIAISLSGASNSAGGTRSSFAWCCAIIALTHISRWKPFRQLGMSLACQRLGPYGLCDPSNTVHQLSVVTQNDTSQSFPSPSPSSFLLSSSPYHQQPWYRYVLALHIFGQGCVRLVRRYYIVRQAMEEGHIPTVSSSASNSASSATLNTGLITSGLNTTAASSTSAAALSTSTSTTAKRKRRLVVQQHQAQLMQPFWAAVARTKIDLVKDYEPLLASHDLVLANANGITNLGSVDFAHIKDKAWIRRIGAYELSIGVCLPHPPPLPSPSPTIEKNDSLGQTSSSSSSSTSSFPSSSSSSSSSSLLLPTKNDHTTINVDHEKQEPVKTKQMGPWYLKINGTRWAAVEKCILHEFTLQSDGEYAVWEAFVTGLAPLESFKCQVFNRNDVKIFETTLYTQAAPANAIVTTANTSSIADAAELAVSSGSPLVAGRAPASATATLRKAINASKSEVEALRNKGKTLKKQQKSIVDRMQAQIDSQRAKLSTTNGGDDRHKQRLKQLETTISKMRQDEEAATASLNNLGALPRDEAKRHDKAKRDGRERQSRVDAQQSSLNKSTKEMRSLTAAAKQELQTAQNKRAKAEGKLGDREAVLEQTRNQRGAVRKAHVAALLKSEQLDKRRQQALAAQRVWMDEMSRLIQGEVAHYQSLLGNSGSSGGSPGANKSSPSNSINGINGGDSSSVITNATVNTNGGRLPTPDGSNGGAFWKGGFSPAN